MKAATPLALLAETVGHLTDLIAALDRRMPQVQRSGEAAIANAAVRLRMEAVKRIAEIERDIAGRAPQGVRPVDSV